MRHKSDDSILFPCFKNLVETYFQTPIISIFSDNMGNIMLLYPFFNPLAYLTSPHHHIHLSKIVSPRDDIVT